jgi:hypothetical protein
VAAADIAEEYPALKLVDFFEGMSADGAKGRWGYSTNRAVARSAVMAGMRANAEMVGGVDVLTNDVITREMSLVSLRWLRCGRRRHVSCFHGQVCVGEKMETR